VLLFKFKLFSFLMPQYHNEEDILCQAVLKTIRYYPLLPHVVEHVIDGRTGYADEGKPSAQ
jgi:hypothetical protein